MYWPINLEKVIIAFKLLKKFKFQTVAFYVLGNPSDTEETIMETINFSRKINSTFAQFAIATPFPGTKLFDIAKKSGKMKIDDWDKYSQFDQNEYFDLPNLKEKNIAKYIKLAYRKFYLRFRFFWNIIRLRDFYMKIPEYFSGFIHFIVKGK